MARKINNCLGAVIGHTRDTAWPASTYLERVTGIELALSAWEVSSAIRGLSAETLTWGILARLTTSDRESPPGLTRSGTQWARQACERLYRETATSPGNRL
jgi:hypothetical protein